MEDEITFTEDAAQVLYTALLDIQDVLKKNENFPETVAVIDEILTQVRGEA